MIIPIKSKKIILIALLFLVAVGFKPSIGARLLENGFFISPENPSAFDPKLNSVVQCPGTSAGLGSGSDPFKEKTRLPCGEPCTLALRLKEKEMVDEKTKEVPKSEEVVMNVLPKGSVSHRENNGIRSAERLAKSKHSPGVGHMQIFNSPKAPQRSGVTDIQHQHQHQHQHRVSSKRILKSTPSPGAGH